MRMDAGSQRRDLAVIAKAPPGVSEVWMERTFELVESRLSLFAAFGVGSAWSPLVEGFDLHGRSRGLFGRFAARLGVGTEPLSGLRKRLRQRKVGVVLIHFADMAVATRRAWEGLPLRVFIFCHGKDIHFDARREEWPHGKVLAEDLPRQLAGLAGPVMFLANSMDTRNRLISGGVDPEKVEVCYQGVEIPEKVPERPGGAPLFLFLGRLVDFKGPDVVIRAFIHACGEGMPGRLLVAGDGPLLAACRLLAHDSPFRDRVEFLGSVSREKVSDLLNQAHVFVNHQRTGPITGRVEAFGVAPVEAMAHGLPVLTARSGGVVETVVDGETGFLVEPGNVKEQAARMRELAADPELCVRLGTAGRLRAQREFSLDKQRQRMNLLLGADASSGGDA